MRWRVGTAGWSIPAAASHLFPAGGTHLQRYAATFSAAEINSSFHREHRVATYQRWADSVPADFRFSVKIPKTISHGQRLRDAELLLDGFLPGPRALGDRAGPLLLQLPPKLELDTAVADAFFRALRVRWEGRVVCEPRHESWAGAAGSELLARHQVDRVVADPAPIPLPPGAQSLLYVRLHGSPRMYYSEYGEERVVEWSEAAAKLAGTADEAWCMFDNTTLGAATTDAALMRSAVG